MESSNKCDKTLKGGLRTIGFGNCTNSTIPLITVITVVFNNASQLEKTIKSVLSQSYVNIEYIIIDGGSNDGTFGILQKYSEKIDFWISEPDKGIYDAMNKGIEKATGSWINFMNSDDEFYSKDSIGEIFYDHICDSIEIIYGDVVASDNVTSQDLMIKAKPIKQLWKEMCFSHQSCFIRKETLMKYMFNLKYSIAADYFLLLNLYKNKAAFFYHSGPIAKIAIHGVSYSKPQTAVEIKKAYSEVYHDLLGNAYHTFAVITAFIRIFVKSLLGNNLTNQIRAKKWFFMQTRVL